MKRILSFLLLITIILCSFAFTTVAAGEILNETFESYNLGDTPEEWNFVQTNDTNATIAFDSVKGNVLHLSDNSKSEAATIFYEFPRQTELLSVSYDLKDANTSAFTRVALMDGNDIIAELATSSINSVRTLYYISKYGDKVPIAMVSNNTWYNVKLNLNLQTEKFDVYYNGELKAKGVEFCDSAQGMDEFRVATGTSYINSVYIDNVVITNQGVVISDESNQPSENEHPDPDEYIPPKPTKITTDNFKGICWAGAWNQWRKPDGTYDERGLQQDMDDILYAGFNWSRIQLSLLVDPVEVLDTRVDWVYNNGIEGVGFIPRKRIKTGSYGTPEEEVGNIADIKMLVNRYKDRIKYWEIGNEPNLEQYWDIGGRVGEGGDDPNSPYNIGVENFYKWMRDTYIAIKEVDPEAVVILGGMSTYKVDEFMNRLTYHGIYEYCDEVALHPYGSNPQDVVNKMESFYNHIRSWPDGHNQKPMWITEVGYTTNNNMPAAKVSSEEKKATYITATYKRIVDWMLENQGVVRPTLYYTLHQSYGTEAGFGLTVNYIQNGEVVAQRLPALTAMRFIDDVSYTKAAIVLINDNFDREIAPASASSLNAVTPVGWTQSFANTTNSYVSLEAPTGANTVRVNSSPNALKLFAYRGGSYTCSASKSFAAANTSYGLYELTLKVFSVTPGNAASNSEVHIQLCYDDEPGAEGSGIGASWRPSSVSDETIGARAMNIYYTVTVKANTSGETIDGISPNCYVVTVDSNRSNEMSLLDEFVGFNSMKISTINKSTANDLAVYIDDVVLTHTPSDVPPYDYYDTTDYNLFAESFENYDSKADAQEGGWSFEEEGESVETSVVNSELHGKVLSLYDPTRANNAQVSAVRKFRNNAGILVFSWKFNMVSGGFSSSFVRQGIRNGDLPVAEFVCVSSNGINYLNYYTGTNTREATGFIVSENIWYTFKVIVNTISSTFTLYVDDFDTPVVSDVSLAHAVDSVDRFYTITSALNNIPIIALFDDVRGGNITSNHENVGTYIKEAYVELGKEGFYVGATVGNTASKGSVYGRIIISEYVNGSLKRVFIGDNVDVSNENENSDEWNIVYTPNNAEYKVFFWNDLSGANAPSCKFVAFKND